MVQVPGRNGALELTVRDHAGAPVPHARVHMISAKLEPGLGPYTDKSGRARLGSLTPGLYNVFVVSPRHPIGILKGIVVEEGDELKRHVSLLPATPVTIRVEDEAGAPIAGARLVWTFPALAPLDSRMAERYEPASFGRIVSDREGRIEKPYLPPGPLTLRVIELP